MQEQADVLRKNCSNLDDDGSENVSCGCVKVVEFGEILKVEPAGIPMSCMWE